MDPSLPPKAPAAKLPGPPVWPVSVAFIAVLGLLFITSLAAALVFIALGAKALELVKAPWFLPVSALLTEASLLVVALGLPPLLGDAAEGRRERLHWRPSRVRALDVALLTLAMLGLGATLEAAAVLSGAWSGVLVQMEEAVRAMSPAAFAAMLVAASLGAGVCEELFFRGVAQVRLAQRFGPWRGILIASALFGLIHADPLHSPMAFLMGLLLGWAAWRAGTIIPGVIAHVVNNALSFTQSWLGVDEPAWLQPYLLLGGAAALALCAAGLHLRFKSLPPAPAPPAFQPLVEVPVPAPIPVPVPTRDAPPR